jgi:DNA-directed RNA polymerase specialized sigma24 family protein
MRFSPLPVCFGSEGVSNDQAFADLIRRVRSGDQLAAAEIVQQYEPEIRREVRVRLHDPRLRRVLDSMDISQSVLGSFFVRVASGQFELNRPDELIRLLMTMTRNKVVRQVRRLRTQRRDDRRNEPIDRAELETVSDGLSPSAIVADAELLQAFRDRLSPEERIIVDRRSQGHEWSEIAAELGGSANARRKQFARAADRAARELGLE